MGLQCTEQHCKINKRFGDSKFGSETHPCTLSGINQTHVNRLHFQQWSIGLIWTRDTGSNFRRRCKTMAGRKRWGGRIVYFISQIKCLLTIQRYNLCNKYGCLLLSWDNYSYFYEILITFCGGWDIGLKDGVTQEAFQRWGGEIKREIAYLLILVYLITKKIKGSRKRRRRPASHFRTS